MSQHTPGPWHSSKVCNLGDDLAYNGIDIISDNKTDIAVTHYCRDYHTMLEARANALLIAAAPDLLEALSEMYHAFLDPDHIVTDRQEAASLGAYRAIYKATGKTT